MQQEAHSLRLYSQSHQADVSRLLLGQQKLHESFHISVAQAGGKGTGHDARKRPFYARSNEGFRRLDGLGDVVSG